MKIIHITDLHIGAADTAGNVAAAVSKIKALGNPGDYLVVITGDIVDDACDGTLPDAWTKTLAPLGKAGFQVLTVPGNHDFGDGAEIFPPLAAAYYATVGPNPMETVRVDTFAGLTCIGLDSQYERMKWIGWPPESDQAIPQDVLVNSDGLMGWIGEAERGLIDQTITAAKARGDKVLVYLHHDPLYRLPAMELGNWNVMKPLLKGRVDVLLCGHSHYPKNYCGEWDIPHFYNGGTTGGRKKTPGPIRVIDPWGPAAADYDL